MTTLSPLNVAAYQACLEEARRQAPLMAKRWYTALLELLFEKSTAPAVVHDKNQIHDAWLALKKYQADIEQGFALQIAQAIAREVRAPSGRNTGRFHDSLRSTTSSLRFQDLELMGDEQVQDTLDEARLAQTLLLTSESGLAGLSTRLSAAQGYKVVKSDKNPLRPEVYASALVLVLQDLPVEIKIRTRWLIYGGQIMGELLQTLYVQLDALLEKQGIEQAGFAVVSSPDEPKRASQARGNAGGQRADSSGMAQSGLHQGQNQDHSQKSSQDPPQVDFLSREQLLTLDHLHRLMSGDYNDSLLGAAEIDTDAEFGVLPASIQRENLKRPASSLGQSMAAQVVGLMIEQLTADQRLLAPVRQLLADVRPAFLRLGAADPSFFNNKNHPARRLLETVTAKSLAFANESDEGFAEFMQDLQASTERLAQNKAIHSLDFAALLKGFEDRQAVRNQVMAESQKLAVKALMQAEQRYLLAEKIALEIRQRRDFVAGNAVIAAFVTGPWAQVMAHERLTAESDVSAKRKAVFSLALGDLLRSANVAQASRHRKWLVKIIPGMTDAVREGLLSIDYPLSLSKPFFDELMRLHELALSLPPENIETVRKNSQVQGLAVITADAFNSQNPWLQSSEAKQSGFMDFPDTQEEAHDASNAPAPQPGTSSPSVTVTDALAAAPSVDLQDTQSMQSQDVLDMQLGIWVELVANHRWVRAQLSWISPHSTLFMFTSGGGHCHSMTARTLEQAVAQGRFRFISRQGVLDSALDGVTQAAIRNSVQG